MSDDPTTPTTPTTPRRLRRLFAWPHPVSSRSRLHRASRTMEDQPFTYYQHPAAFDPYPGQLYPQPPYDAEYTSRDENLFGDSSFASAQSEDNASGWSAPFTAPDSSGVAFQRRGAVSGVAMDQSIPEGDGSTMSMGLRIDTSICAAGGEQRHVQEATGSLASPLNIRPPHLDSATTPTSFPSGPHTYDTTATTTNYDMNHNYNRGTMPLSLTMPPNQTYFMGHQGYDDRQLPQPQSALSGHPTQRQQLAQDQRSPYTASQSPQLRMHSAAGQPYGTSTQPALPIPYTPSSITSGSVRSVSPASTAPTSAQPQEFPTYASPIGDYEMGTGKCAVPTSSLLSPSIAQGSPSTSTVPIHSPTVRQPGPLSAGASHALSSVARPSAGPASPIRRRANKQRLDDARRKEICTYARDRPKARQEDIASRYGVERSTISKILKNKDKWLSIDTQSSRKSIPVKHRPSKFPEIETELLKWVKECQENGTPITDTRIKTKARECAAEIGLPEGKFKASSGWIENFKIRNSLTRRAQDEREVSPSNEEVEDPEHMDEDDDSPIPASQSTRIEERDGYEANTTGQDSFNSFLTASTDPEHGIPPHENSFSTFSTDSMVSSQDLSLLANTPMSSTASSFASSPSGTLSQHIIPNSALRARGHSHSFAMRGVGPSCSPQPGGSPIQPLSPARLDMRFTSTPGSTSIPRFPSPLSASTSASGNPLVMVNNARRSPVSQKHSRHPSDASAFSYDVTSQASNDPSSGFGTPLFEAPSSHQALEALDTVLKYFQQPQTCGIASQLDYSTFAAVRARLAERLVQSLSSQRSEAGPSGSDAGHV